MANGDEHIPEGDRVEEELLTDERAETAGAAPTIEGEGKADPRLNTVLPTIVGTVLFNPTISGGGPPPTPEQALAQYVEVSSSILNVISFHECLGVAGELSKTVRLGIGVGTMVLLALFMQPKKEKKKKEEVKSEKDNSES